VIKILKRLKSELFYIRNTFFIYKKGPAYIRNRFFLARRIIKRKRPIEKGQTDADLSIHILTCHNDLIMTLWSLASFFEQTESIGMLYVHDDGSLTSRDKRLLKRFFPSSILVGPEDVLREYGKKLSEWPVLREFREKYVSFFSFKKIIDPFIVSDREKHLILDSDLLWFEPLSEIENAIRNGCCRSLMQGTSLPLFVNFRNGERIDEKYAVYNAGIILYARKNFDPERLTEFLERLDTGDPRNLHFADQLGHAYCLRELDALPLERYIIKGQVRPGIVVRHDTSPRRPLFYIEGMELLKERILGK
jgi:hypothetical protein